MNLFKLFAVLAFLFTGAVSAQGVNIDDMECSGDVACTIVSDSVDSPES
ncbi:hypothetical protein [Marinobacter sp. X15-166B]|nr:hypothetical protein [Marinobacter sp. X15-166B]